MVLGGNLPSNSRVVERKLPRMFLLGETKKDQKIGLSLANRVPTRLAFERSMCCKLSTSSTPKTRSIVQAKQSLFDAVFPLWWGK